MKIYKNGHRINLSDNRRAILERRTEYRPTWPYYLALISFALVMAWVVSEII